jgi:nicotinate dehydrogenase subunit B
MADESSAWNESWEEDSDWSETGAIKKANQVDDWLAIDRDGTITVFSGKIDSGTGVQTALAQIVAEELDVPIERVQMVMGDTARTPDEGITAGSTTIRFGGFALRHASAEARRALLEMAAHRLDAVPDELVVRAGVISVSHPLARTITFAELLGGKRFNRAITLQAPLKRPEEYRIVGQPVPRLDLPRKFVGAPSFVHDVRVPGMLHARVVRPPGSGAELVSIDETSVQDARVVRLGNFIGVVAEREEQAVRATRQLKVEWQETVRWPAMEELQTFIRRQPTSDAIVREEGKVESALRKATARVKATYHQPFQAHASIGPSCAVADVQADRAVIWCSTRGVYPLRDELANLLQMRPEEIQVIYAEGSGSYGHNGSDDAAADAAVLSRAMGRPVRVQWSREQEFAWEPFAPAMEMEVHGGLDKQGNVIALAYDVWTPSHVAGAQLLAGQLISGPPPKPPEWFGGGDRNAPTNYNIPNQRVQVHWLSGLPLRTSSMRSLGGAANTFANESFMDELAAAAKIDPLEFRLRHLDDARAIEVVKQAAEHAGWGTPLPAGEGRGIAFAQYENEEAYVATVAQVRVDTTSGEVRVKRMVVAHDCGLIINPDGLRNQIEGNVIQSTSRALKEQVTWEDSHITSLDWESYPILKFSEVPDVEIVLINHPDQPAVGTGNSFAAPHIAGIITLIRSKHPELTPFQIKTVLYACANNAQHHAEHHHAKA